MQTFIQEVIEENRKNFTEEEYKIIMHNIELTKKIYLLGFVDARDLYKWFYALEKNLIDN